MARSYGIQIFGVSTVVCVVLINHRKMNEGHVTILVTLDKWDVQINMFLISP